MNMITAIEDAMLAALKDQLPRTVTRIDVFPDDPEAFDFPEADTAACFLRYDRSTYAGADNEPRRAYAPTRTLTYEVVVLVRSMRGADGGRIGAHDALEAVRLALQGRSFAGATAMALAGDELQQQKGSVWRWAMRFTCRVPAVARSVAGAGDRPTMFTRAEAL